MEDIIHENTELKNKIAQLEERIQELEKQLLGNLPEIVTEYNIPPLDDTELSNSEISRYGRQLILKNIGPKGK